MRRTQRAALRSILARLAFCATCLALGASTAWAESSPHVVVLVGEPFDPGLPASLSELLGRIGLVLVHDSAVDKAHVLAFVRIVASPMGARIHVDDGRRRGVQVEREVTREGSAALLRETVAHVLLGIVEPLTELAQEEPTRERTLAEAPPQVATMGRAPSGVRVTVAATGGPLWLDRKRTAAQFGAGLAVGWSAPLRPTMWLDGAALWPVTAAAQGVEAELTSWSFRARPSLLLFASAPVALTSGLSAGLDIVSFAPSKVQGRLVARERTRRVQPIVGTFVQLQLALRRALGLFARAALELDMAPRRWVVAAQGEERQLLSLARVRPVLQLGVFWSVPVDRTKERTP